MKTLSRPQIEVNPQGIILAKMPRKVGTPLPAHVVVALAARKAARPVALRKDHDLRSVVVEVQHG